MIQLSDVSLRRGPEPLIENANLSIFPGDKLGIVGRNGSGKSSLLALLQGELHADKGDVSLPPNLRISAVAQSLPAGPRAVVDYVIDGDQNLRAVERQLAEAHARDDGLAQARLLHDLEVLGGYTARSRAAAILDGLGFDAARIDQPLDEFSGGMRMRVSLARALMCPADLLILDEPTNHLDLDAVVWLETWLCAFRGTLLLVSHDREFLDAIVSRIVQLSARALRVWSGNYSQFESAEVEERRRSTSLAARQQVRIRQVQAFVNRFRAQATKARQVQSRIKWLDKLPAIAAARNEHSIEWDFAAPRKLPQPLLTIDRAKCGYPDRPVLSGVSMTIGTHERIGVLGRNGAGKSTLMRLLAGELGPAAGEMTRAPDLEVGFFAQMELEQLDANATAIEELTRRGGSEAAAWSEQQKRDHLGRFGFSGDRAFDSTRNFSGGERARLTLSILVARRPNMLLLDEPTNHLDIEMRASLLFALQTFAGAVIVVSHDRALLRSICDRLLLVEQGRVSDFDGDLDDYARYLSAPRAVEARAADSSVDRREQRRREAEARNRLSGVRRQLQDTEQRLNDALTKRAALDAELADDGFYASASVARQQATLQDRARLQKDIEALENQWLEISERLAEQQQR